MGRNGLIALVGLAVLFFALSELIGDDKDEGILSRIAGSSTSEISQEARSEDSRDESVPPEAREMLDEVQPEPDDKFGEPFEDEDLLADDGLIDSGKGFAPSPDITPSGIASELGNGGAGGQAANPPGGPGGRTISPPNTASSGDALARDLAKAGVIDESRKRR